MSSDNLPALQDGITPAEGEEPDRFSTREEVRRVRQAKALQLRMMGVSYTDIAKNLEISVTTAATLVESAIAESEQESKETITQLRIIENRRLERLNATFWAKALKGDQKAFENLLKLHDRRVRLNGLEAPQQINLTLAIRTEMEEALQDLEKVILSDSNIVDGEIVEDENEIEGKS